MKKGSISFKIVIFFSLLAILINCFSFSCLVFSSYGGDFHDPADPYGTNSPSPSPSPTPTISSSPFVLPVVSIQDDTPLTSFLGTDSSNPSVHVVVNVLYSDGSSSDVVLPFSLDISDLGVIKIFIPYPFGLLQSGFRTISIDIDLLPYKFGAGGTPSNLFNYLINSVSFDYSISFSNPDGFSDFVHPCIQRGSFGLFKAFTFDGVSYNTSRQTVDYFYVDSGSFNFKYDNVNAMRFRYFFNLYDYPDNDVSHSGYTLTLSNFIINDTALLFDGIVSDTDNITSNIDDKLNDLTQSISLSTPNTVGIINTVSESFNNIDPLSASVLFSWTHDSFVVTILIMVISFGLLGYIFFGKRG